MPLGTTAKRWLIIASIPIVLLLLVILGAKLYFTGDRLKALVVPKIEEASRRPVSIGEISLSVIPSIAVEIDNITVSNAPGASFSRDAFLVLDRLTLKMSLWELISGKADITEVVLDHPKMYFEKNQRGGKNYSSAPAAAGERAKEASSGGGALLLSHCEINDGEIEYLDRKYDVRMVISGFHQTLRAELKNGEHVVTVEGATSIEKLSYGSLTSWYIADQPLSGSAKISYDMEKDIVSFDECTMKLKDLPLAMSGTISKVKEETMMVDLSVNSPGASMEQLLSLIPPDMLKKTSGLSSSGEVKFAMQIKGPSDDAMSPGASGTFTITGGSVKYASLPKSITNINLRGSFDRPAARVGATGIGAFAIEKLSSKFGSDEIGGSLAVKNFSDPSLSASFAGTLNLGEVKDYYPLEKGTELAGTMKLALQLDGKVKNPQGMKASGKAEFQDVTIQSAGSTTPLKHLNGTVAFSNLAIESKQLSMSIGESDLTLAFTLKNYLGLVMPTAAGSSSSGGGSAASTGKPSASMTLTSRQLRTADLMGEPAPKTGGSKGQAEASKPAGILPGIDIDANVQIARLVTEKFTFTDARGELAVADGIVHLKHMNVQAFQGAIETKGMIDLRNPAKRPFDLDLNITNVQSNDLLPKFTSFGQYLFGKFSTTTKLKGDLNDTLGLDTGTLLGSGNVQIADGRLAGLPLTAKLADVTGVNELREVNFKSWTNTFAIENGRIQVKDLKVNAGTTDFTMGGSQGLDGTLDYALVVKLPGSFSDRINLGGTAGQLLELFKDKDGRYNFAFDVGGTSTSPVVRLNAKAQEGAAKNKLEEDLKKKAQEGLLKLFKKP